jgi:hypothetical protein
MDRTLLFLIGCMGTRFGLAYLAMNAKLNTLNIMGYIALIPAIGILTIYMLGLRKTGIETNGELIWWNNLRPLHGILWLVFAYLAILGNKDAWIVLLIDTIIGLLAWIINQKIL